MDVTFQQERPKCANEMKGLKVGGHATVGLERRTDTEDQDGGFIRAGTMTDVFLSGFVIAAGLTSSQHAEQQDRQTVSACPAFLG